jgi:suppressor of ftsI
MTFFSKGGLLPISRQLTPFLALALFVPTGPAAVAAAATTAAMPAAQPLRTPPEYRSKDGVLAVTIEARATRVVIGDHVIDGATYNGDYGGPVLRLSPGDTLRLHVVNHLPQVTNVHFHGLSVTPEGHGDNSMRMIAPGDSWDYIFTIPKDHPPGVYWYHTHGHDFAERQVMGGLSGTLVIEGFQDEVPVTKPLTERLMALKEFSPNPSGHLNHVPKPSHGTIKTINGQLDPMIAMQPGETQLWRLSGQTADGYFRLRAKGLKLVVLGRDARPLVTPEATDEVLIGPSERVDVLATAGASGRYSLMQEKTDTGPLGDMSPPQEMASVVVAADPSRPVPMLLGPIVVNAPKQVPVPGDHIDARRLVVFSEDVTTGLFFINHQTFDPKRTDIRVPLGSTEEWTVRNASQELHVFHIHQVPFQVVSINGRPQPFVGLRDTIDVPIHGEVKIRMAFTDPRIVGRFMYHCHILEHEDKGMMASIEVYDPAKDAKPGAKMPGMTMSATAPGGHDAG